MQVDTIYNEAKYWLPMLTFIGLLWKGFSAIQWVKQIKDNHLHHIQSGIEDMRSDLKDQTDAIVGELKELRQDMRTVTQGLIAQK